MCIRDRLLPLQGHGLAELDGPCAQGPRLARDRGPPDAAQGPPAQRRHRPGSRQHSAPGPSGPSATQDG
eukprot:8837603-Alexandrium_andersonii.AAC.1